MTVDPYWIRSDVDRLAIEEGCYFDEAAGLRACKFVETFCRQSKGRWAGKPLSLLDWQRDLLMRLFGWKQRGGLRRYRTLYLEVAKKNGKSTLVSAISLYLLIADGEGAPEIYLNAVDKKQAEIIFDEAAAMVRSSPELAGRLKCMASKRIVDETGGGVILANSKVVDAKDGVNPHGVIFDELHRQPDRLLFDVFEYASAAREQPIHIRITTAGEDDQGVWHEQREYSEKVNAGIIADTSHLGIVYRAEPGDDLDAPATWLKANPSLGVTIKESDFKRELKEAKEVPIKLANFMRLRLNIIQRGSDKFVDLAAWDRCNSPALTIRGETFYAGLDLSSTTDLSALLAIHGSDREGIHAIARFWLPEANIVQLERRDKVPYRMWADQGFIVLTPGNVIDYEFIRAEIKELAAEGDLKALMVDPHMATQLCTQLAEQDGLPVTFLRQGFLSLSAPTKELLRLILSGKINHGGNPVLRWMASNAVAVQDAAGNIKLDKRKSRLKIDGMAALVNATAGLTSDGDTGESVYETRGVLIL